MKRICIILILTIFCSWCKAQISMNYKRAADIYFQNKEYFAAATFYKKALNITPDTNLKVPYRADQLVKFERKSADNEYMIYKLAESSRMYKNFNDAEVYYGIAAAFSNQSFNNASYWYGVSLRANQKFDQAIQILNGFLEDNPNSPLRADAEKEIASARFAAESMRFPKLVQIKKLPMGVNAAGSNYAPFVLNGNLFFTSSRPITPEGSKTSLKKSGNSVNVVKKATPFLNTLYMTDIKGREVQEMNVKFFEVNRPAGVEFAAATFNSAGNRVYFTAWQTEDPDKKYSLWTSYLEGNNQWTKPVKLSSINMDGFNTMQPFITEDGKTMLFASDRPGGYGKFDIWYCSLRADGEGGIPVNLGSAINTVDDEEAPYYNVYSKNLLFSTNGRIGLGGFDFFESNGDFVNWTKPVNMGYPFNSSKDDMYFTASNKLGTEGYISSDRSSLCCLELFEMKLESIHVRGNLIDCKSNKPLQNATVTLQAGQQELMGMTDQNGNYHFTVSTRQPITLKFEAEEHFSKSMQYSTQELAKADTLINTKVCLTSYKKNEPIVLKNIYFEFNNAELNDPSKETLNTLLKILNDNEKLAIELSAHTDNIGADKYNLDLSDKRATSCVNYLIAQGISANRLFARGYGKRNPIAPNQFPDGKDNPEGRQLNRRIEFKVIGDQEVSP